MNSVSELKNWKKKKKTKPKTQVKYRSVMVRNAFLQEMQMRRDSPLLKQKSKSAAMIDDLIAKIYVPFIDNLEKLPCRQHWWYA